MIKAFNSFLRVYGLTSRSVRRSPGAMLLAGVGFTCVISSCGERSAPRDKTDTIAFADTGDSVATEIVRQLHDSIGLRVRSVTVARGRIDLTLQFEEPQSDPDSEYRSLAAIAERIWALGTIESRAETVAVTAVRGSAPSGVLERNTYFYYWSERSVRKDR